MNFSPVVKLNEALANELLAINQYFVHSKMFKDMGFLSLSKALREHSIEEMQHADSLIDRILYCKGLPKISYRDMGPLSPTVEGMLEKDLKLECDAVNLYNEAIAYLEAHKDFGSASLIRTLLKDEEGHVEWLEHQLSLIKSLGLQQYLVKHG
ncbi:bacterioferritin [Neorickettsia helminthoeca str. Oregon]|uniref:Bacterioferritin n=1 Tax=Neorickettsia helminthoeca str. Oregon TaxID=1286528 RepID=X5GW35_9RICK|nr:bacterioferritin [Neorickettsia helminthoeca]AHX11287.1 bacterioferritin [Neorickettsia helminthoeca str. Oregon]